MSIVKDFRFPVSVRSAGGRRTVATVAGKPPLEVATPPEFKHGIPGVWSPEDLLVGAAATCYAVTLVAVFERSGVALHDVAVDAVGHITRRADGMLGFVALELEAELETDPGAEARAERLATKAKDACIVTLALDVPVHVHVRVRTPDLAEVA